MMVSFEKWLKKTRQVPESAIRWYVRWVEMCLSDANIPTGKPIPKRKAKSLSFMKLVKSVKTGSFSKLKRRLSWGALFARPLF